MNEVVRSLDSFPNFSFSDFSERWRRARLSALRPYITLEHVKSAGTPEEGEASMLASVAPENHDAALKLVFDNSRKFGRSAMAFFGLTLDLDDIKQLLGQSSSPCHVGTWRSTESGAQVLERKGCDSGKKLGGIFCSWWREAVDGLVMGVGEDARFARHSSAGHGDENCIDVFYRDPSATGLSPHKWGPVPPLISQPLGSVAEKFEKMRVKVTLEGYSEGKLYYRLDPHQGVLCGGSGTMFHDMFKKEVLARHPHLMLQDTAPLAVYGSSRAEK